MATNPSHAVPIDTCGTLTFTAPMSNWLWDLPLPLPLYISRKLSELSKALKMLWKCIQLMSHCLLFFFVNTIPQPQILMNVRFKMVVVNTRVGILREATNVTAQQVKDYTQMAGRAYVSNTFSYWSSLQMLWSKQGLGQRMSSCHFSLLLQALKSNAVEQQCMFANILLTI